MDHEHDPDVLVCGDRPRRRGDGPHVESAGGVVGGSAPQARGWTGQIGRQLKGTDIGPASAGMDPHFRDPL